MTIDRLPRLVRRTAVRRTAAHRRQRRSVVFALTVSAVMLWFHAAPAGQTTAPTPPPAAPAGQATGAPAGRVDVGAMIYRKVGCFQCHVNEAQGGANGPKLGPDPVPFARFTQYVRQPTGSMPPYTEKVLSARDLADIYEFLRARPRPPAVSSIPLLAE